MTLSVFVKMPLPRSMRWNHGSKVFKPARISSRVISRLESFAHGGSSLLRAGHFDHYQPKPIVGRIKGKFQSGLSAGAEAASFDGLDRIVQVFGEAEREHSFAGRLLDRRDEATPRFRAGKAL